MPLKCLSCLLGILNCKNWKTLFFRQDIRKSKSKMAFLCLKSNLSSVLTSLTKSRLYLFLKMPISEKEAGNLIHAINRNTKVVIRNALDTNNVINSIKPVTF